jgi:hypothetical protein
MFLSAGFVLPSLKHDCLAHVHEPESFFDIAVLSGFCNSLLCQNELVVGLSFLQDTYPANTIKHKKSNRKRRSLIGDN